MFLATDNSDKSRIYYGLYYSCNIIKGQAKT
jgi:hypothetical protein